MQPGETLISSVRSVYQANTVKALPTAWSDRTVLNCALEQTAVRSGKSSGRVRRDLKKLPPAQVNSRSNIVERVWSLDAHVSHVRNQTKPESPLYFHQADAVKALPFRLDLGCLRTNGLERQNRFKLCTRSNCSSECKVVRAGEPGLEKAAARTGKLEKQHRRTGFVT